MIKFEEIFKQSFLDGYEAVGTREILVALGISCLFAAYIFTFYRMVTKKTFYSKTFNISLAGITVITAAVILTIQSSIVVSLGMVGALSIVRFRTAVKEPLDLMFMFWAISSGIICGAGVAQIGVVLALILTIIILLLDKLPQARVPMLLIVNSNASGIESKVMETVKKYSADPKVKSRNMTPDSLDLVFELRTNSGEQLVKSVMELDGVTYASLISHNGELTY